MKNAVSDDTVPSQVCIGAPIVARGAQPGKSWVLAAARRLHSAMVVALAGQIQPSPSAIASISMSNLPGHEPTVTKVRVGGSCGKYSR